MRFFGNTAIPMLLGALAALGSLVSAAAVASLCSTSNDLVYKNGDCALARTLVPFNH